MMRVYVWSVGRQGRPGSVGGRLLVLGVVHGEEVLELPLEGLEGGSLQRVLVPALEHDLVEGRWAVLRTRHAVSVLHLVEDFGVCHAWKKRSGSNVLLFEETRRVQALN